MPFTDIYRKQVELLVQTLPQVAEDILIRRLAEVKERARRKALDVYTFEEAAMRYLEEIAHKASADRAAIHLDQA